MSHTRTLDECIKEAEEKKIALGHFNVSNLEMMWAIGRVAKELGVPVVIGVSEGERNFVGTKQTRAMVDSIKEELDHPIFLNADHTYTVEGVKEAIDAGYDSVIFDGTKLSTEENLKKTREVVMYVRSRSAHTLVEAELGNIGHGSVVRDSIPEEAAHNESMYTKPDFAKMFVDETGVDLVAPAVGNIHGMVKSGNPHIKTDLIEQIREFAGVPLVLHGGSGITDEDFIKGIEAGISTIHINTELRLAWRQGLVQGLSQNPDEIAPYKYVTDAIEAFSDLIERRIKLFARI
ncbi:MAG: tagatose-bisphosphate aldolase [Candidatus Zambryskibacteria bacterium CG10_big_fil_rev_8_21_14_0_10_42_12]|uniref:Tagatose-bisphosphate aldolase n=1 Tax=Candidatus Zambryskibacteria bacterium CG10_big_fil_rev_8_21_14_0_10_42_12 TaxID=1975115 RepID=A0A2H0QVK6_9BACT|nr:MAG: tagatose-bisphosphate aldolase [Candidatus Zambryskibacteria bacterium CG10_big_fil_rev_8_21_14_0_10_42_12]